MNASHSKSAFFYEQILQALHAGRYVPGQRIDPATLALEFDASQTPVRQALQRLLGAGLLEDHARNGLRVPLPTEVGLRQLYDWLQRLFCVACDIGFEPESRPPPTAPTSELDSEAGKIADRTWRLFAGIAGAAAHPQCQAALRRANDQLAPIRPAELPLLEYLEDELATLDQLWVARDIDALKKALRDYHERRRHLVPCIVEILNTNARRFH